MSRETTGGEQVLAALGQTLGCGSARFEYRYNSALPEGFLTPAPRDPRHQGDPLGRRLLREAGRASGQVLAVGLHRMHARVTRPLLQGTGGVIDFAAHRCVYRFPGASDADLVVGDRRWHGAPGSAVDDRSAGPASAMQPLWLVDLVRGVVDACEHAVEDLDGRATRRHRAHADLHRAADAVPHQMAIPGGTDQLDDLKEIAVDVWIDDAGYIRRIRCTRGTPGSGLTTGTVDLIEFGVALPSDWSRLPLFPGPHLWE